MAATSGEKKPLTTATPKEIIHHKFGDKASYRIEEVRVPSQKDSPCLYRCHLELPEFTVVSNVFKKKKDSEQSAAELALEKLGIQHQDGNDDDDDITVEEAWDDITERLKYIFSDEFLSSDHPLGSHIRATLQRDGERLGSVPVSVIATFDAKISSRCKVINPSVDSDPTLAISDVLKAAEKLSDYIVVSPNVASLRRKRPYPQAVIEALATRGDSIKVEAVRIQCTTDGEEVVEPVTLDIASGRYYLDIIGEKLGMKDGNQVMISRIIGKTSSGYDVRVYSTIPKLKSCDNSWKSQGKRPIAESSHLEKSQNVKASVVCGQDVHGDAIVASVGYQWRSPDDLEHDDLTIKSFYRMFCGMSPNGIYKLSRGALISARLPFSFTTKSNWRGLLPREILCTFCRQQQLAEPIFTISTAPLKPLSEILRSHQKLKDSESEDTYNQNKSSEEEDTPGAESGFRCAVKILSKSHDLVLDCSPGDFYEKENHAVQNASLKALSWFNGLFDELDAGAEQLPCYTSLHLDMLYEVYVMMNSNFPSSRTYKDPSAKKRTMGMHREREQKRVQSVPDGSLISISYSVYLEVDADLSKSKKRLKELVECKDEIEFETGNGSMNPHLESVVSQMYVGQYACFSTDRPCEGLLLAAASDTVRTRSLLSELVSGLEYSVHLLAVKGPREKHMEAALFKPPLSKQRIEYAMKCIKESSASSLVDFGCGSGKLLASLLECSPATSVQTIVGVDISQKGLARAAKMLDSKLEKGACNLKSVVLYDGSILEFDSRLHDIDIGTCLEVIEHMEEDQASQFGETVLSLFQPKLLIVSTPNYEYNKLLLNPASGKPKGKVISQLSKFRNQDHKFEWTRKQFNNWATKLATRHNYTVEFSGVGGGSGKGDPGFASQIAVFRRQSFSVVEKVTERSMQPYKVIWEWTRGNGYKKTKL